MHDGPRPAATVQGWHKEFLVETAGGDTKVTFVKDKGSICGMELFTKDVLTCTPIDWIVVEAEIGRLASSLAPPLGRRSDDEGRGFGIEFELAAREPPEELLSVALHEGASGGASPRTPGELRIHALRACFRRAAADERVGKYWAWLEDPGVRPASRQELQTALASQPDLLADQASGQGFELVSPGPPRVPAGPGGMREVLKIVKVLRHMGVQAPPFGAGVHVHVNVASDMAPGVILSARGIASVWVAYARFQFAIDEMLSPSRLDNAKTMRLDLVSKCAAPLDLDRRGASGAIVVFDECVTDPCSCLKRIFRQFHNRTMRHAPLKKLEFCNHLVAVPGKQSCRDRNSRSSERNFQLNVQPLGSHGTLEFRAHSATYDEERLARWQQFVLAFVEHFGAEDHVVNHTEHVYFSAEAWEEDYAALASSQRAATLEELFRELGGRVHATSLEYFKGRAWENGTGAADEACRPPPDGGAALFRGLLREDEVVA